LEEGTHPGEHGEVRAARAGDQAGESGHVSE
jgi:hypothetical protein